MQSRSKIDKIEETAKPDGKQIVGRGKTQRKIKALKIKDAIKRQIQAVESTSKKLAP